MKDHSGENLELFFRLSDFGLFLLDWARLSLLDKIGSNIETYPNPNVNDIVGSIKKGSIRIDININDGYLREIPFEISNYSYFTQGVEVSPDFMRIRFKIETRFSSDSMPMAIHLKDKLDAMLFRTQWLQF